MRVWLYYRLSRDEDDEQNSLINQRKIIYNYAMQQGYEIAGESCDDNISGMHFNRPGIEKIYEVVENGLIDAVLVKDLSRLGRHRTQTAMFIDYLREHNVRVLSATENIDTFNENDDLIIGFKGLVNDFYARDGGRRVRTGFRQKQKDGIIMIAPFGYFKDKNTRQVVVVEEAAETVRLIFSLYTAGRGLKAIAQTLNQQHCKTPAQMQRELLNKRPPCTHERIRKKHLWDATMVKRVLTNEIYTGTLVNHKSERSKINKTHRIVPEAARFRHEGFCPAIVSKEIWQRAQFLLDERKAKNVRAGHNQAIHRYAGLLRCGDCGRSFTARTRSYADGSTVVEYTCNTYLRYGKEHCGSHAIREDTLDRLLQDELISAKHLYQNNWQALEQLIESWAPQANLAEGQVKKLRGQLACLEEDIEAILLERIRDRENTARYSRMIEKRETDMAAIRQRIDELENLADTIRKKQASLRKDISLIDEVLNAEGISEAQLRLLVDGIIIREQDGGLDVNFRIKAPFRTHFDQYDDEQNITYSGASLSFDFERLAPLLFEDVAGFAGKEAAV